MNKITAEEYELLGFFEVEPEILDSDTPWIYNDSVYKVHDTHRVMTVAIQPSYKDVRIILTEGEEKIFEFAATGVEDIKVINSELPQTLEIIVNKSQSMLIKRKPHIGIYLSANEHT